MQKKILFSLFLIANLSGCSHIYGDRGMIKNHDTDYLKAQAIEPLKMPPGYSNTTIQSHYPVPQRQESDPSKKRVVLTPPELNNSSQ
jgi:uncharacterized lipoprotein